MQLLYPGCIAVILLSVASERSPAQDNIDSRTARLEETVRVLEERVGALEAKLQSRITPARAPSSKANWRQLQKGMAQGEVEQLLGEPTKIEVYQSFTVWHYGSPGGGTVQFDGDTRTVESWHEP
jgi:hypothetical protein